MKLLIVGLGSMGKRRARLIQSLGGHELCGVDAAPARRAEAEGLGIKTFDTLEHALAAEGFDAGFVCTAPLSHAGIIDALLDANLPVFTELNLVADGYEGLMAKAKAKNLTLFLSNTMLYRAEIGYITGEVARAARPVNYIFHIGQYLPDWHPWENYKDFFVGDARTGGVREILAIDLPWLLTAFGPVERAEVMQSTLSSLGLPYPDSLSVLLRHAGGHTGFLAADVVSPKAVRNFEAYGEGLQLFWEGNPQSLFRYDADTKQKQPVQTYERFEQDSRYSDNIVENAYLDEILNFFAVLKGEQPPRWSFERDLEAIDLMDILDNRGKTQ